jgi:hypothetical protein
VLVAVGGSASQPTFVERSELRLLPEGAFAPYHAAEGLEPSAAHKSVNESIAAAHRLARAGIEGVIARLKTAGHSVRAAGVLVGTGMPPWTTEEILAVHVRMHKAEGELFRDALVAGAQGCGLVLERLPDKTALDAAAVKLKVTPSALASQLNTLGKAAGAPWTKDQKEAAAAALVALAGQSGGRKSDA